MADSEHARVAVALWEPHPNDCSAETLAIYEERNRYLPKGPLREHHRRARHLAIALSDGAYLAVQQMADVFPLESGEASTRYARLDLAHALAQPSYTRMRDYLHECGAPYLVACLEAATITREFDTRRRTPRA